MPHDAMKSTTRLMDSPDGDEAAGSRSLFRGISPAGLKPNPAYPAAAAPSTSRSSSSNANQPVQVARPQSGRSAGITVSHANGHRQLSAIQPRNAATAKPGAIG